MKDWTYVSDISQIVENKGWHVICVPLAYLPELFGSNKNRYENVAHVTVGVPINSVFDPTKTNNPGSDIVELCSLKFGKIAIDATSIYNKMYIKFQPAKSTYQSILKIRKMYEQLCLEDLKPFQLFSLDIFTTIVNDNQSDSFVFEPHVQIGESSKTQLYIPLAIIFRSEFLFV